ncbi:MAG: hypothetical protein ABSG71_22410 [Thermodesulfobacteriota bacterium]
MEDRILIVDDEEVICSILARRLTREGYSCVTAHNGKEGLNHVEAIRLGACDFIIKPADLELVVLSVKKALEKKRLEEELEVYHKNLEKLVEERTARL